MIWWVGNINLVLIIKTDHKTFPVYFKLGMVMSPLLWSQVFRPAQCPQCPSALWPVVCGLSVVFIQGDNHIYILISDVTTKLWWDQLRFCVLTNSSHFLPFGIRENHLTSLVPSCGEWHHHKVIRSSSSRTRHPDLTLWSAPPEPCCNYREEEIMEWPRIQPNYIQEGVNSFCLAPSSGNCLLNWY